MPGEGPTASSVEDPGGPAEVADRTGPSAVSMVTALISRTRGSGIRGSRSSATVRRRSALRPGAAVAGAEAAEVVHEDLRGDREVGPARRGTAARRS